jgi:hypothetical protein
MDAANPLKPTQADLSTLVMELRSLRDLLVTLSLQLTDIQFESDPTLRAEAILRTDQLLKACQSHIA